VYGHGKRANGKPGKPMRVCRLADGKQQMVQMVQMGKWALVPLEISVGMKMRRAFKKASSF
jgi:hypothetical protein